MQNILNRKRKGFTLIELIVVIAIIGILVLLAMPKFMDYTRDAKDAKTQHDARVAEDAVTEHLVGNDDKLPGDLAGVTPEEIQDAIDEGRAYDTEGPVAEVPEGPYVDVTDLEEVKDGGIKTDGKIISNSNGDVFIILDKAIRTDVCVLRADQIIRADNVNLTGVYTNTTVRDKYPDAEFYEYGGYIFISDTVDAGGYGSMAEYDLLLVDYIGTDDNLIVPGKIEVRGTGINPQSVGNVTAIDDAAFIEKSIAIAELPCTITGTMASGNAGDTGETPAFCTSETVPDGWIGVYTAEDLDNVRNNPTGKFIQMADIDLSTYAAGTGWSPIYGFYGSYDGNCLTIDNLTINDNTLWELGLFGVIDGYGTNVTIQNLILNNVNINGSGWIGTVAGVMSYGTLQNITVNGQVTGNDVVVGGIVGVASYLNIIDISTDLTIKGTDYVGGILGGGSWGAVESVVISDIEASGSVEGSYYVGGLVGAVEWGSTISDARITNNVTGDYEVGGIAGYMYESSIINSYYDGNVSGGEYTGGLIGQTSPPAVIRDSYVKGTVAGTQYVGGMIGNIYEDTNYINNEELVIDSYSISAVSGNLNTGGLVGFSELGQGVALNSVHTGPDNGIGEATSVGSLNSTITSNNWDTVNTWDISAETPNLRDSIHFSEGYVFNTANNAIVGAVRNYFDDTIVPDTLTIEGMTYPINKIGDYGLSFVSENGNELTIPSSVDTIMNGGLWGNYLHINLANIENLGHRALYYADFSNINQSISIGYVGVESMRNSGIVGSITIKPGVTTIPYGAFRSAGSSSGTLTINLPASIESLGGYSFYTSYITTVNIGSDVIMSTSDISSTFKTAYDGAGQASGTYKAPSQTGVWTKQ